MHFTFTLATGNSVCTLYRYKSSRWPFYQKLERCKNRVNHSKVSDIRFFGVKQQQYLFVKAISLLWYDIDHSLRHCFYLKLTYHQHSNGNWKRCLSLKCDTILIILQNFENSETQKYTFRLINLVQHSMKSSTNSYAVSATLLNIWNPIGMRPRDTSEGRVVSNWIR